MNRRSARWMTSIGARTSTRSRSWRRTSPQPNRTPRNSGRGGGMCMQADQSPTERAADQANRIAKLRESNAALAHALTVLYLEQADYIRINNLGDVHQNHSMRL